MGVGSALLGLIKLPFKSGLFFFKYGIPTLILLIIFLFALIESIQTGSPVPIIRDVGGRLINADHILYVNTLAGIAQTGLDQLGKIWLFITLIPSFWFVYLNYKIFSKVTKHFLSDNTPWIPQRLFYTFLLMYVIQVLFSLLFTPLPSAISLETAYLLVPFKGIALYLINIPWFFSDAIPFLQNLSQTQNPSIMQWLLNLF